MDEYSLYSFSKYSAHCSTLCTVVEFKHLSGALCARSLVTAFQFSPGWQLLSVNRADKYCPFCRSRSVGRRSNIDRTLLSSIDVSSPLSFTHRLATTFLFSQKKLNTGYLHSGTLDWIKANVVHEDRPITALVSLWHRSGGLPHFVLFSLFS